MSRDSLKAALKADIECHDAQLSTTPHLSRIRHAEAALLGLLEETGDGRARDYVRFDESPGYVDVRTKRGTFRCLPVGHGMVQVDVREIGSVSVEGAPFVGAFTVGLSSDVIPRVTYWGASAPSLSARREKMMLEEVVVALRAAASGEHSSAFAKADVTDANNDIWRLQTDLVRLERELVRLERELGDARLKMVSLLARESEAKARL